jgi:hypothetical protein
MTYESEHCYPDLLDLQSVLKRSLGDKKDLNAEDLYQDFRVAHEWLKMAIHLCHYQGRHQTESLSSIKSIAEGFIGRNLSEDAFLAAVCITGKLKPRDRKREFCDITIKVPPFSDREKISAAWKRHVEDTEKENRE